MLVIMRLSPDFHARRRVLRTVLRSLVSTAAGLAIAGAGQITAHAQSQSQTAAAQAGRIALYATSPQAIAGAADAGQMPGSQHLSLTLTLTPTPDRTAALTQFLTAVSTPGSPSFHKWLSPADFATAYGASASQIGAVTAWAQAQGLSVDAVSPSGLRIAVSGPVSQVQTALAVPMEQYQVAGQMFYAASSQPSLPADASSLIAAIDGLDNLPADSTFSASAFAPGGKPVTSFATLAALIDANQTPVLTLDSGLCSATASPSAIVEYSRLFQQAAAQGVSVFADRNCAAGSFPAALAEVTAVALPGATADSTAPLVARPSWQIASGLPADGLRYAPDVTASSVSALAQTISTIVTQTGTRQGNVSAVLYSLAATPNLYTQPDAAPAGTWEAATGLGQVNLDTLVKIYPRGAASSSFAVAATPSSASYGTSVVLAGTVQQQSGLPIPTGTVTFSSTTPSFSSGGVYLNGSGVGSSQPYSLPAATYPITSVYSGDPYYAGATATTSFTITPLAAAFSLVISTNPASIALGSSLDVDAVLTSPGFGTPNASVTVTPNGGGLTTAQTQNLSGGSGATVAAPYGFKPTKAGTVQFQAACTPNDSNFTCYNQPTVTATVPQASSITTLTVSTATPVAGATVTLKATVAGVSGIPPTGTVQFMDGSQTLGSGTAPNATYTGILPPGVQSLTAVYQGDTNYLTSTGKASTTVGTAPTTVTISPSAATLTYGQVETFAVTVTGANTVNGTQPTGTLTFTGIPGLTTVTLTNGTINVPVSNLPVGTYPVTVSYGGDTNYAASATAATTSVTVTPAVAPLNAVISSNSFNTGSTATLTVNITIPGNGQLPAGTTFTATVAGPGTVYTGTFTVNPGGNTGTGQVTVNAPLAGTYQLQIACGTTVNFTCTPTSLTLTSTATSSSTSSTVNGTLVIALSSYSFTQASTSTLTATLTLPGGAAVPAGSQFVASIVGVSGATYVGTFTVNPGGNTATGQVTLQAPVAGTYTLQVSCAANAAFTCTPRHRHHLQHRDLGGHRHGGGDHPDAGTADFHHRQHLRPDRHGHHRPQLRRRAHRNAVRRHHPRRHHRRVCRHADQHRHQHRHRLHHDRGAADRLL